MISSPCARRRTALAAAAVTAVAAVTAGSSAGAGPAAGADATYVVLYRQGASSASAAAAVQAAGGTLVANYREIGVVIARSSSARFESGIEAARRASRERRRHRQLRRLGRRRPSRLRPAPRDAPAAASDLEPLAGLQWDMRQINAFTAHDITGGSPDVVVGDVDTGLDFTHPDIAPNYDAANSADCSSGTPQPLLPGNDANGHGTHTAGTIAVPPSTASESPASRRTSRSPASSRATTTASSSRRWSICSYMWVAARGIDVTNNSYFADPWLFNCRNDAEQRAIWKAERRAIRHAQSTGTVVVASQGNDSTDLSHPEVDVISPDFPPGSEQEREITNACAVVPVEVPGVVGVTATGDLSLKSFYSSYGVSTAGRGRTGWRLCPALSAGHAGGPERPRAVDVSFDGSLRSHGVRPHDGRHVLLPAGHVDGRPARRRRRRPDRQPHR